MIDVGGVQLGDSFSWINKRSKGKAKGKTLKDVVLLVSTQNIEKRWKAWEKTIRSLSHLPSKVIFCENDSTDATIKLIDKWDFSHELITFRTKKNIQKKSIYSSIANNRQLLLERARKLNPKYAIYLDDDVFPQDPNFIEKLTKLKLPIVGGTYLRPFGGEGVFVASKWHVDLPLREFPEVEDISQSVINAKEGGNEYIMFSGVRKRLYKVTVTSAGCLCLNRKVLQDKRLNFLPLKKEPIGGEMVSEDFGYCLSAGELGYKIYLHGGVFLAHLHPTPDRIRPWSIQTSREPRS